MEDGGFDTRLMAIHVLKMFLKMFIFFSSFDHVFVVLSGIMTFCMWQFSLFGVLCPFFFL